MISKKILLAGLAVLALLGVGLAAADVQANASPSTSAAAGLILKDGVVSGRNVGFSVDANGDVANYTSRGPWGDAAIFESISFAASNATSLSEKTRGPVYVERDAPDFSFVAFDARNAAFLVTSAQGNVVTLKVPAGVSVQAFGKQPGWSPAGALLTSGDHTAKLTLHGNATVAYDGAGTIAVTMGPHSHVVFRITGYPGEAAKERKLLERAAEGQRAAAKRRKD
ncbi:MAG: hypothetical protein QOE90_1066 [Thermoplasmata archaeon]|jgi:hypothetical protein|nr:hypothetical protein [Thermoplasmata archaeon]